MLIIPSALPGVDYVINPYLGCGFGCKYCYAKFMARFVAGKHGLSDNVNNLQRSWGNWVIPKVDDVNNFGEELKKKLVKLQGKKVLLSSVTDPYQPKEAQFKLTRKILKTWLNIQPNAQLEILTRSALVLRDLDLLKKLVSQTQYMEVASLTVGVSISVIPEDRFRELEPYAPLPSVRVDILKTLKAAGINVYAFIAPVWPGEVKKLKILVTVLEKLEIKVRFIELLNRISRKQFRVEFSSDEINEIKRMGRYYKIIWH